MRATGYSGFTESLVAEQELLTTAEDVAQDPPPERCELVAGRVVIMSPASFRHGVVAGVALDALTAHVREHGDGLVTSSDTGYLLRRNPDTVRAPDVAFVSTPSLGRWREAGSTFFPGAPDLAVEVLSPSDPWVEVEAKVQEYLAAGGRAVWVVNPRSETVYVYTAGAPAQVLTRDDEIRGGELLPGFSVPVSQLFELPPGQEHRSTDPGESPTGAGPPRS